MTMVGFRPRASLAATIVLGLTTAVALSQPGLGGPPQPRPAATLAAAPVGFDARRDDVPAGTIERVEFDSNVTGGKRPASIYLPPGYTTDQQYPVLYLLHGIGGNETRWAGPGDAGAILDNSIADGKAVPMIVVMPNGRASNEPAALFAGGSVRRGGQALAVEVEAYAAFERELLGDLIPFIEARYSTKADRMHRAIAGLSMGGGQALNFGLGNVDTFAWVGGFSSAPNTRAPAELAPDPDTARRLELLWVSCGDEDELFPISAGVHEHLSELNVPHEWHIDDGGHTFAVWKNDLYHFTQLLFR